MKATEHSSPTVKAQRCRRTFLVFFFKIYFKLYVYVYASVPHACRCPQRPEMSEPLELDLQTVVSLLVRVLGTKLGPSASMGNT